MTIAEQIKKIIDYEHASGKTQKEIGDQFNIDPSYINRLLLGQRKYSGLTLHSVQRMFPNATLNLTGDISMSQRGTNYGVVGVNNGMVSNGPSSASDCISRSVLESLILHAEELSAEERVKFLLFLKERVV